MRQRRRSGLAHPDLISRSAHAGRAAQLRPRLRSFSAGTAAPLSRRGSPLPPESRFRGRQIAEPRQARIPAAARGATKPGRSQAAGARRLSCTHAVAAEHPSMQMKPAVFSLTGYGLSTSRRLQISTDPPTVTTAHDADHVFPQRVVPMASGLKVQDDQHR